MDSNYDYNFIINVLVEEFEKKIICLGENIQIIKTHKCMYYY